MKLKNLKIDGVSKGKDLVQGKTKLFDFIKLRKYFNIGCQIDLYAEEYENETGFRRENNDNNNGLQPNYNSDEYKFVEEV
jgi:hypothetical protein